MDVELLEDIASARGDHANPVARAAFGEFYQRHVAWLYHKLRRTRAFDLLTSNDAVHDVVQETFYRAFKGAKTFNPDLVSDPSRLEGLVRGWLGGIANRVIADMLGSPKPDAVEASLLEPAQTGWRDDSEEPEPDSPVVQALLDELKKLSPLQRDVIAAAEYYFQPGTTYQRLPNGVTQRLAEKHCTSSDNIRQVRRRTMATLRRRLQSMLEET